MENENESLDLANQEEEQATLEAPDFSQEEEYVQIPKDKFKSMQRKAIAYDATKKTPLSTKEESHDDEVIKTVKKLEMLEDKRSFGYENQLSPEETDFVFRVSGGKPTKEILNDPFVKSGIEGFRSSKRASDNIPTPSSSSPIFQGKEFKEMTPEERQAAFEKASEKFRK